MHDKNPQKSTRYCVILTIRPPVPLGLVYHGPLLLPPFGRGYPLTFITVRSCRLSGKRMGPVWGLCCFPAFPLLVSRIPGDFSSRGIVPGTFKDFSQDRKDTSVQEVGFRTTTFFSRGLSSSKRNHPFLKWCLTSGDLEHERNQHPFLKMNECRAGKGTISTGELSSYHHFLGDMSVFRGVKIGGLGRCLSFSFGGYFQVPAIDFPRMYRQCPSIFSPKKR